MSDGLSAAALADTARFWTERTGEHVSEEDAREAICNVAAFVDLLARWDADTCQGADVDAHAAAGALAGRTEVVGDAGE